MLENINKIIDSTRKGQVELMNVIDMSESSAIPLSNLGIKVCAIQSIKNHYKLVRGNGGKDCILLYLIDGEVEFETHKGLIHAKPGYMMHYPLSTPRRIELVKGNRYTELMLLIGNSNYNPLMTGNVSVRESELMPQILDAFNGYINETNLRKLDYLKAALSFANQITVYLAREMHIENNPAKSTMNSAMEKLWDAVRLQPHADWTVEKMASYVNSSPTNFFRMVERQKGFSPKKYVTDIRMEKAKMLIETGNYSLKDIADAVGYSSVYSFSHAFLQHIGIRPGAYRSKQTIPSK